MRHTGGIGFVAVLGFLIFSMPRLNVRVGDVPVYAIDVISLLILTYVFFSGNRKRPSGYPFRGIFVAMVILCIVSELMGILYGAQMLDALYLAARFFLAHSVIFAIPLLIRSKVDIELILKAIALALLINAGLMILTSLPMTRQSTILMVFSHPFLEPAADLVMRSYLLELDGEAGARGRTLVGVSILGASFAAVSWPLVAYLTASDFRLSFFGG